MSSPFLLGLADGRLARAVRALAWDQLPQAVAQLGIGPPRPVLVVVGGADLAGPGLPARLVPLVEREVVPLLTDLGVISVDGGTDTGVMRILGSALGSSGRPYTLVGVAAEGTVRLPPSTDPAAARLEPHLTHLVLVPGATWGDESRWLARTASLLSVGRPSVTLVANGGALTYADVGHSLAEQRPVIVLRGSGRAADDLAAAVDRRPASDRAKALADSELITVCDVDDAPGLTAELAARLSAGSLPG